MSLTGYLAAEGFEKDLAQEIELMAELKVIKTLGRLLVTEGPLRSLAFAQNTWKSLQSRPVESITQTAKELKAHGKLWTAYSYHLHRRVALIQENLPKVKLAPHR